MFVIFYFLLLVTNSNQVHQRILVKLLDDNSDDSNLDSVRMLPTYFINYEDIPSVLTDKKSSSLLCIDRINFTRTEKFQKFLSFEIGDNEKKYFLNNKIEICDGKACIIAPPSSDKKCSMAQIYESIKLLEFNDNFLLFSKACYYRQYGVTKYEGGIIFQKENNKLSKGDYLSMLDHFGMQRNLNMVDLKVNKFSLTSCKHCSDFFDDLTQYCNYEAIYDNSTDILIFIGVASIIYLFYFLVTVFYYNS